MLVCQPAPFVTPSKGDLKLVDDATLDSVVNELCDLETPPIPVAWAQFEELVQVGRTTAH